MITDRNEDGVLQDKVNRLRFKIFFQEVRVSNDRVVGLDVPAGELDLFHFFVFLDVYFEDLIFSLSL